VKFTPDQRNAIQHTSGHLQLLACAGSGKTEVVAQRVAHLLNPRDEHAVRPTEIIAFTFTDRAAAELKDRIIRRCREQLGDVAGLAEMFVGTTHAYCLELLKREVPKYLKFDVLNEVQQRLFIDRHSAASGLTTTRDLKGQPLRRYVDTSRFISALSILREADWDRDLLQGSSILEGLTKYEELLERKRYLDYSAILQKAAEVLTTDHGLRARLAGRVKHVIVDEYQDLNPVQERVVSVLKELGADICVVGDDDQTVYQWRGSDVENILTFQNRYLGTTQIRLEENFRSSDGVVETARAFIQQNTKRLPKAMKPTAAQDSDRGDIVALSFKTPDEEAAYIAANIRALHGVAVKEDGGERGVTWADMAILLRSVRRNGEPITRALDQADIPYVVVGMNNLFDTREAEAARTLFYFMAGRDGYDIERVERDWIAADMGLDIQSLRAAIVKASDAKRALSEPDHKRWSLYNIQRQFLTFLENAGVREERVPNERGEVVFYNLGKFSQAISDFEAIYFHSKPIDKYTSFASFLQYQAEDAYPEGWQDNEYANPNAVRIMTVHQAKGMQWPVVFVPALIRNRFPARAPGGRSVWHILPEAAIPNAARYRGSVEDERRLFYVALTRSQKFLHLTWAPIPGNQQAQRSSDFWEHVLGSKSVKRRQPDYNGRNRLPPVRKDTVANVVFSFSDLKYFFECPYSFKLRVLYGFNAPLHEALGYGKSLHDALAEVHARSIRGDIPDVTDVERLLETHLHTPYAYPALREQLETSAGRVLTDYLCDNRDLFEKLEFSEKQIEIALDEGVSVVGRIDLVRRVDTGETTIVDLKSSERAQAEDVTETQLHVYALGYQELTGRRPDFVEIYELDERKRKPRSVDDDFIADVRVKVAGAAESLRTGTLMAKPAEKKCAKCDYQRMCSAAVAA
jgi:DNA helicase-2/ATP-dependent DNA helicase PcrA